MMQQQLLHNAVPFIFVLMPTHVKTNMETETPIEVCAKCSLNILGVVIENGKLNSFVVKQNGESDSKIIDASSFIDYNYDMARNYLRKHSKIEQSKYRNLRGYMQGRYRAWYNHHKSVRNAELHNEFSAGNCSQEEFELKIKEHESNMPPIEEFHHFTDVEDLINDLEFSDSDTNDSDTNEDEE